MIITIYENWSDKAITVASKHEEFIRTYGPNFEINTEFGLYRSLARLADWCNNEVGEELLFDID